MGSAGSFTLQCVFSQQRPPLVRVQLVSSPLLGLLFDHVAPGGPQSLGQSRTDPGETGNVDGGKETMNRTEVAGQSWRREDLQTETQTQSDDGGVQKQTLKISFKLLTVFSSACFWDKVKPSRIFPIYDASLLLSVNKKKQSMNYPFLQLSSIKDSL